MARPTKLTEKRKDDIVTALMLGSSLDIAAQYAGITPRTLYLWREKGRIVYERLQAEEEKELDSLFKKTATQYKNRGSKKKEKVPKKESGDYFTYSDEDIYLQFFQETNEAMAAGAVSHLNYLDKLAPTDPKVSMWLLERRYPEAFAQRPTQIEHSGVGGQPIETKDVSDLTMEERAVKLLAIFESARSRATADEAGGEKHTDAGADPDANGAGAT